MRVLGFNIKQQSDYLPNVLKPYIEESIWQDKSHLVITVLGYLSVVGVLAMWRRPAPRTSLPSNLLWMLFCGFICYYIYRDWLLVFYLVEIAIGGIFNSQSPFADLWVEYRNVYPQVGWRAINACTLWSIPLAIGAGWLINLYLTHKSIGLRILYVALLTAQVYANYLIFLWVYTVGTYKLHLVWVEGRTHYFNSTSLILWTFTAAATSYWLADYLLRYEYLTPAKQTTVVFKPWTNTPVIHRAIVLVLFCTLFHELFDWKYYKSWDIFNPTWLLNKIATVSLAYVGYVDEAVSLMLLLLLFYTRRKHECSNDVIVTWQRYSVIDLIVVMSAIFFCLFGALPNLMFWGASIWLGGYMN